jgi:Zn-dependent M28 family amino/carboxypeptidase
VIVLKVLLLSAVVLLLLILLVTAWVLQPTFRRSQGQLWVRGDPVRLRQDVAALTSIPGGRSYLNGTGLATAAAYIRTSFAESGARVTEQVYYVGTASYTNVIASFGPETGDRIIVGAHYDTVRGTPGADDNASGVAGLLELARALSSGIPQTRIDLVAYVLEELPFFRTEQMGSYVHAKSLRDANVRVRAMICLEMIGYYTDLPNSQEYPLSGMATIYGNRGDFIALVGNMGQPALVRSVKRAMLAGGDLPIVSANAPRSIPGIDYSDHLNYWAFGYPAVMLTDTAFYRNPNYHATGDTPDTLDYQRMAKLVDQIDSAVMYLAGERRLAARSNARSQHGTG